MLSRKSAMKHDDFFRKHPVFTGEELANHLSSRQGAGSRAKEALLAHYRKTGRVVRVRRGLYAVIPAGAAPNSYPVNLFLVTAKLTEDAVLSYHTALELHGRAHSVQEHFTYSSSRPLSPLTFRSHVFRGVTFPQALRRAGKESFGVLTAERAGMEIRVASLERTLVDVLDRPDLSGSWEEIWRSLESVEFFDLDKVVEYALLLGNATTAAKAGFFLEQHREPLMVEDRHLKSLHDLRPRQPHYLDRAGRKSGRLVSEWNLVIPREVIERAWGEVL
jgi:predicted transcriptional regulator of viral defense system